MQQVVVQSYKQMKNQPWERLVFSPWYCNFADIHHKYHRGKKMGFSHIYHHFQVTQTHLDVMNLSRAKSLAKAIILWTNLQDFFFFFLFLLVVCKIINAKISTTVEDLPWHAVNVIGSKYEAIHFTDNNNTILNLYHWNIEETFVSALRLSVFCCLLCSFPCLSSMCRTYVIHWS